MVTLGLCPALEGLVIAIYYLKPGALLHNVE
jgi:hypothetical protein